MLDLVAEAEKELQILPLCRVRAAMELLEALRQVPVLRVAVDLHVTHGLAGRLPSIPRTFPLTVEDRVKQCRPSDRDEHEVLSSSESRAWAVVDLDCGYDRLAALV